MSDMLTLREKLQGLQKGAVAKATGANNGISSTRDAISRHGIPSAITEGSGGSLINGDGNRLWIAGYDNFDDAEVVF